MKSKRATLFLPSLAGGGAERNMVNVATLLTDRGVFVDMLLVQAVGPLLPLVPDGVRVIDLAASRTVASLPALLAYLKDRTARRPLVDPQRFRDGLGGQEVLCEGHARRGELPKHLFGGDDEVASDPKGNDESASPPSSDRRCRGRRFARGGRRPLRVRARNSRKDAKNSELHRRAQEYLQGARSASLVPRLWASDCAVRRSIGRREGSPDVAPGVLRSAQAASGSVSSCWAKGRFERRWSPLARRLGIDDSVDFPGFRTNPYGYMARAQVFALASTFEGLSLAIIEALASGVPVVSTDCPHGPAEILEDGKWGRLVQVGDWRSMAKAILAVIESPPAPGPLIERSRSFSLDAVVPCWLAALFPGAAAPCKRAVSGSCS